MRNNGIRAFALGVALTGCGQPPLDPVFEREALRGEGMLFLLVQEEDCGDRLLAAARLDTLRSRTRLGVVALVVNGDDDAAARVARRFGVGYPVVHAPEMAAPMTELVMDMGYRATPLLLGVGPGGRLRFTLTVPVDPVSQARAVQLAEDYMARAAMLESTVAGP